MLGDMKRSKYAVAKPVVAKREKDKKCRGQKRSRRRIQVRGLWSREPWTCGGRGTDAAQGRGRKTLSSPVAGWGLKPSHLRLLFYTMHFSNSCGSRNGRLT